VHVIASLSFPRLHAGSTVGEQTVLQSPTHYPVDSFTLVYARGAICSGRATACRPGRAPFYLVHAPGRLRQPDLIQPCTPAPDACSPPGAFYAIGWKDEAIAGGYRSGCDLRLDRKQDQFYCTNSGARWDRVGRVITRPAGAHLDDPLQFAFANVSWDGHVILVAGVDSNPPRETSDRATVANLASATVAPAVFQYLRPRSREAVRIAFLE
jgi:hypothetical protein